MFLFVAFFAYFLTLWLRPFWRLYRSVPGGKTFQFKIIDYWAAMLGLAPTFILISDAIRTPLEPTLFAACVVAISQLSGIFIGRVHNVLPPRGTRKSGWEEAGWIFLGAVFGLALVVMGIVLFLLSPILLVFLVLFNAASQLRSDI